MDATRAARDEVIALLLQVIELPATNQLFDYATWRSTKTAILMFSRNKDFKAILSQIPGVIESHEAFKETLPDLVSHTEFRFRLRHPQDPEHEMAHAVLAFNVLTERSEV